MSNIKKSFVSRFANGRICEFDFGQLEVIGLAVLSNDQQLKEDLRSGIDLHCMNAANLYNSTYENVLAAYKAGDSVWTKKRKITKAFSFQLQYGSGAKNMSASNDVPIELAQEFIVKYYQRYWRVKEWQEENILNVKRSSLPSGRKSDTGFPVNKGELLSSTGRVYEFIEFDSPKFLKDKGIDVGFSPTQIKNYPVQGFSTGDVMPVAFGEMIQYLLEEDLCATVLPINTIHDSVLFDVDTYTLGKKRFFEIMGNLRDIMLSTTDYVETLWPEINFDVPLSVDIECGKNWGEMKSLDI